MTCYSHPGRPAVGTCSWCYRGLCSECAVEIASVLACRGRCEVDAERLLRVRKWSIQQPATQHAFLRLRRTFFLALGAILLIVGIVSGVLSQREGDTRAMALFTGVASIGVALLWYGRMLRTRLSAPTCSKCGYNLTGNRSGRCPECGEPVQPT
jgi:predicted amidophosphoribosyltransferase